MIKASQILAALGGFAMVQSVLDGNSWLFTSAIILFWLAWINIEQK